MPRASANVLYAPRNASLKVESDIREEGEGE